MMENKLKKYKHIILIYLITISLYYLFQLLSEGKIFNLYSNNKFNDEKYIKLWKETTSYQRYAYSDSYYNFIKKLETLLTEFKQSKINPNIEIEIEKIINTTYETFYLKYKYTP